MPLKWSCIWHLLFIGDGRYDSPGFTAKYCTYTLQDLNSDHIVDYVLLQVGQVKNSVMAESEGCRRVLHHLKDHYGFTIECLATDRSTSVSAMIKKEFTIHMLGIFRTEHEIL